MWIRVLSTLILLFFPGLALAQTCIEGDRAVGATFGTAEFIGEPWVYTWQSRSVEDSSLQQVYVTVDVPGEALQIRFDNSNFVYGAEFEAGHKADNLRTLQNGLGDGPFTAVRLRDSSVIVMNEQCQESWQLRRNHPTTPVATDTTIISDPIELECLEDAGIIEYQSVDVGDTLRVDHPIRSGEKLFLSFGLGEYVIGKDTWGEWSLFRVDDSECAASSA